MNFQNIILKVCASSFLLVIFPCGALTSAKFNVSQRRKRCRLRKRTSFFKGTNHNTAFEISQQMIILFLLTTFTN